MRTLSNLAIMIASFILRVKSDCEHKIAMNCYESAMYCNANGADYCGCVTDNVNCAAMFCNHDDPFFVGMVKNCIKECGFEYVISIPSFLI